MLATVYLYLGKKCKHLGTVCVRREREEGKRSKGKLFKKILGMGEWAPLFLPSFQPYPHLHIPQGVSRETCLAWHGLGLALIGMAWHGPGLGLGH